jgi:hypothetical protein
MWDPFAQYNVMRGTGCGVLFSLFAVLFFIVTMPYMAFAQWRHSKLKRDFGSFDELKAQRDEHGIVRRKND